jgi:hypothetical protein
MELVKVVVGRLVFGVYLMSLTNITVLDELLERLLRSLLIKHRFCVATLLVPLMGIVMKFLN